MPKSGISTYVCFEINYFYEKKTKTYFKYLWITQIFVPQQEKKTATSRISNVYHTRRAKAFVKLINSEDYT